MKTSKSAAANKSTKIFEFHLLLTGQNKHSRIPFLKTLDKNNNNNNNKNIHSFLVKNSRLASMDIALVNV